MPIARCIIWVGTSLLALLFVVSWFLPEPLPESAHEAIDSHQRYARSPSFASVGCVSTNAASTQQRLAATGLLIGEAGRFAC